MKNLLFLLLFSVILAQPEGSRGIQYEGILPFYDSDVDSSLQSMNSSDGRLFIAFATNNNSSTVDLRFYNTADDTIATGEEPLLSFQLDGGDSTLVPLPMGPYGATFSAGIKYAAFVEADSTDPSQGLILNAVYVDR